MRRIALALLALLSASTTHGYDVAEGFAAYRAGDLSEALKIFKALAEQGDADAQFYVGTMYATGEGVI